MCAQTNHRKSLNVIDAGDGKGYLSTRLSLEHKIKVLGVDCNPINVNGALVRSERLEVSKNITICNFYFIINIKKFQ